MRFTFTVHVEVERESGKFAGRDEIAEQIRDAISDADPGEIGDVGADGDSSYSVTAWEVES